MHKLLRHPIAVALGSAVLTASLIGGAAVAAEKITSADIADNTIKSRDLRDSLLDNLSREGDRGPRGPKGPQGDPALMNLETDGPHPGRPDSQNNLQNLSGNQGAQSTTAWAGDSGATLQSSWVQGADGKTALGGGFSRGDEGPVAQKGLQIVSSRPVQVVDDNPAAYTPIDGDVAGSFVPNGWMVEGYNNSDGQLIVRPWVVCAEVAQ